MKFGSDEADLDAIDMHILGILQENCKLPLAKVGEQVGLSAPAVIERIKKLEDGGVIVDYRAILDARKVGKDVTAFIGVEISHPKAIGAFEAVVADFDDVLECHHVTGQHTLLLKVKTKNTATLEGLIQKIREVEGVIRTETMVVLSTHTERTQVSLPEMSPDGGRGRSGAGHETRRALRNGDKHLAQVKGA
jgi:Lrp/AsnC family transcriptional regulator, leucine-responsive regulatory protein